MMPKPRDEGGWTTEASLDELLRDDAMRAVLRSAGLTAGEFRDTMICAAGRLRRRARRINPRRAA